MASPLGLNAAQRLVARSRVARSAMLGYQNASRVHYTQGGARWQGIARGLRAMKGQYPTQADCLAAGTLVTLDRGPVPIEDVRVGDLALTRKGYRTVLDAWLVREDAEVVSLPLADGRCLIGTPDHRVWSQGDGWATLQTLTAADMLLGCNQAESSVHQKASTTRAAGSFATRRRLSETSASTSTRDGSAISTVSSGLKPTALFQRITRFITLTGIRSTTPSRTSWQCHVRSIADTLQTRASAASSSVRVAVSHTFPKLGPAANTGSAVLLAANGSLGAPANISPSASAWGAAKASRRTSTAPAPTARIAATRPLAPATPAGRSDVYDLTVEGEHEFFANGVLVHNCSSYATWCHWDATRSLGLGDYVNGAHWQAGFTGTQVGHGKQVTSGWLLKGDLVFYGGSFSVPGHVAIVVKGGPVRTALAVSHGSEHGPHLVKATYRPIVQIRRYLR